MLHPRFRSDRRICRIDFSAFVAIIIALFTLLIWAAPTGFPHHGMFIRLPQARHALELWDSRRNDALLITIARDGQVFFGSQRVAPEELVAKLFERTQSGAPRTIYIRADAHARYHTIADVLDSIQFAGLKNIAFLTEPRRPKNQ
jgi:biopolymer transport protein ExbD